MIRPHALGKFEDLLLASARYPAMLFYLNQAQSNVLSNLNEARDLPADHDYRAVLAQVLRATFAMTDSLMDSVPPHAK